MQIPAKGSDEFEVPCPCAPYNIEYVYDIFFRT